LRSDQHCLNQLSCPRIAAEGTTMQMMLGNGFGFDRQGLYVTSMLDL
jgi:amidase